MNEYICTSCGYRGKPKKWTKGSFAIELLLWFFFIIPGLIYSIWRLTNKVEVCSSCKQPTMIPIHSPMGQKLMHEFKHSETKTNDYSDNGIEETSFGLNIFGDKRPPINNRIKLGLGILLVIILFLFIRGESGNTNNKEPEQPRAEVQPVSSNNSIRTATTQPSAQEKTESMKQPSIRSYQLGEAFSVQSDISNYNSFKWDITKTSLTKLDDYKVTNSLTPRTLTPKNGKFYIISFEGINRGNKAWYISISFADKMVLIDKNGKRYARNNSDAESAYLVYSHKYPTTDVANPDESTSMPILFDVPEQEYKLCDEKLGLFCIEGIR